MTTLNKINMNFFSQIINLYRKGIGNDTEQLPIEKQIDKIILPVIRIIGFLSIFFGVIYSINSTDNPIGMVVKWLFIIFGVLFSLIFIGSISTIIKLLRKISNR